MGKILKLVSIFSFFIFIFYFLKDINLPFVGPFGNNNSTYSIQAKNYLRFGLIKTKFAPVNKVEDGKFQYYLHHPPLLQLLTALSYKIFGRNFWWPGRFFPVACTLASIVLMALIANQIWGKAEGWLAFLFTLFFASTSPFLISFGKIIQFEPLLLCATLLFTYYIIKHPNHKLLPLAILTIIGCLIDWPMILFLFVFYLLYEDPRANARGLFSACFGRAVTANADQRKPNKFKVYLLLGFVTLSLFFLYTSWLTGPKELISAYISRGFGGELFGKTWAILKLALLLLLRIIIYFTPFCLLSGIIFFLKKEKNRISLVYFFFGGLNVLLLLNGAYSHPYWLYYLTPFFILESARLTKKLFDQKKWRWLGIILLITNTAFSVLVIRYKDQQTKKALWQDTFIDQVALIAKPHQTIATSWDFNEELFRYKTGIPIKIYWSEEEITKDVIENPKFDYFIFSCWANCHPKEGFEIKEILSEKFRLVLREKEDRAILYDLTLPALKPTPETISPLVLQDSSKLKKPSEIILFYQKTRDFFGVNQI